MRTRRTERKSYIVLMLLTGLAVGGMLLYKTASVQTVPSVETAIVSRATVKETVVCTGTVTAGDGVEVYATVPCVAGDVAVEVGDRVKEGDVLLCVDRGATLALAVSAGLSSEQTSMASAALPTAVTAPADGIVSAVNAAKGDALDTASPCVVLSEGGGVEIAITIRESLLPRIAVGQEVAVSGVAFDKEVYNGTVTDIASSARSRVSGTTTQTVVDAVVSLQPDEVDESLLIGLTAKASITVASRESVLLVPYNCVVQEENGEAAVYCLRGDTAVRCAVTLGDELSEGIEVLGGITEGDTVICNPEALQGEQVTVKTEDKA